MTILIREYINGTQTDRLHVYRWRDVPATVRFLRESSRSARRTGDRYRITVRLARTASRSRTGLPYRRVSLVPVYVAAFVAVAFGFAATYARGAVVPAQSSRPCVAHAVAVASDWPDHAHAVAPVAATDHGNGFVSVDLILTPALAPSYGPLVRFTHRASDCAILAVWYGSPLDGFALLFTTNR